ncbi:alpha-N-acetylneuraminide alpha-2,8-sialyltransferase-like [Branchiostoma lanceolatum]|uniref:alpha-N-acetylneuraminide alpha-2,8-sialyltransferase-like n=1 Tax=Branchiostoma lanceolatum TaxID=7740 RepID=UPI0034535BEB
MNDRGKLVEESPFKAKKFQTCSVAGNGGILKGSGCGEEIDASEFVFRCNMAPMYDEHLTDIGKKTSLITINPTLILYRYHTFANTTSSTKTKYVDAFVRDLSAYGDSYLLIPAFFNSWSVKIAFLTRQVLQDHNARNEVIFPHPDFVRTTQSFWRENGLGDKRPSSGLVLLSAAMQMCEEVRLYGFWPFHADRNSARLTEHYYDNALPTNAHSVPDEFRQLQRLHNTGVLRLTTTACQRQDNVYH